MKFTATIHAYDCLDQVAHYAQVRQYGDYEEGQGELVMAIGGVFPGEGIDNPKEWLRDVLVGMLERL